MVFSDNTEEDDDVRTVREVCGRTVCVDVVDREELEADEAGEGVRGGGEGEEAKDVVCCCG
jgi:hypothetical protein